MPTFISSLHNGTQRSIPLSNRAKESTCRNAMGISEAVLLDTDMDCPVLQKLASSSEKHSDTWCSQHVFWISFYVSWYVCILFGYDMLIYLQPLYLNTSLVLHKYLTFESSNGYFNGAWIFLLNHRKEEVCQRVFSKHGLRLPVPITYVPLGANGTLPILKPSSFLNFIDKTRSWERICGEQDLKKAQQMFTLFWQRFEQLYPNFELFERVRQNKIRLDRACPVYIHGDEGTYYKKSAVMVLQWQGVLGKGTVKKQVAQHGVNSIGHTLRTRLLCGVMTKEIWFILFPHFLVVCVLPCVYIAKGDGCAFWLYCTIGLWHNDVCLKMFECSPRFCKDMYGDDNSALEQFYEHIVHDFAMLSSDGLTLMDGEPFWLIPLGVKGDWPFLDLWLPKQILRTWSIW